MSRPASIPALEVVKRPRTNQLAARKAHLQQNAHRLHGMRILLHPNLAMWLGCSSTRCFTSLFLLIDYAFRIAFLSIAYTFPLNSCSVDFLCFFLIGFLYVSIDVQCFFCRFRWRVWWFPLLKIFVKVQLTLDLTSQSVFYAVLILSVTALCVSMVFRIFQILKKSDA